MVAECRVVSSRSWKPAGSWGVGKARQHSAGGDGYALFSLKVKYWAAASQNTAAAQPVGTACLWGADP